jgi:hypothetical protein
MLGRKQVLWQFSIMVYTGTPCLQKSMSSDRKGFELGNKGLSTNKVKYGRIHVTSVKLDEGDDTMPRISGFQFMSLVHWS